MMGLIWVTKNLDSALRRLRKTHKPRMLWADAACIDQENNEEKGEQVQLMGQIFRKARRVVAWLGPGYAHEGEGMAILATLSRAPKHQETWVPEESSYYIQRILSFLQLDWFRRLWIVQECVLNAECCLVVGASKISFQRMISGLLHFLNYCPQSELTNDASVQSLIVKLGLWKAHCKLSAVDVLTQDQTMDLDILNLVGKFSGYQCSDDHDRIFALHGLATNTATHEQQSPQGELDATVFMKIDYSINVDDTYITFAYACIKGGMFAQVVNAVARRSYQESPMWPSWVPNWRTKPLKQWSCAKKRSTDTSSHYSRTINFTFGQTKKTLTLTRPPWDYSSVALLVSIDELFFGNSTSSKQFVDLLQFCQGEEIKLLEFLFSYFALSDCSTVPQILRAWRGFGQPQSKASRRTTRSERILQELNTAIAKEMESCCFFRSSRKNFGLLYGWTFRSSAIGDKVQIPCYNYNSGSVESDHGLVLRPSTTCREPQDKNFATPMYRLIGEAAFFSRYVSLSPFDAPPKNEFVEREIVLL